MNEAIEALQALYGKIKAERWKDNHGKLGVLTGIRMCILRLKIEQVKGELRDKQSANRNHQG